jgi:hypothetical protein
MAKCNHFICDYMQLNVVGDCFCNYLSILTNFGDFVIMLSLYECSFFYVDDFKNYIHPPITIYVSLIKLVSKFNYNSFVP